MKSLWFSLFLLGLAFQPAFAVETSNDRDPLLVEALLEPSEWNPGQAGTLVLKLNLAEKFHAYEDQFKIDIMEPDGFVAGKLKVQPVHNFYDKFSKKNRMGFQGSGEARLPIEAPSRWLKDTKEMTVHLIYQACSDSFCLFPTTKILKVALVLRGAPPPPPTSPSFSNTTSSTKLNEMLGQSLFLTLIFVFLAGILTSFTPCIFPMIPITLAILGHGAEKRSRLQNFLLSICYVHGIAFTYSILGVVAASSGAVFGATLGNPWVLGVICAIFLLMALSMYGVFELQVPAFLRHKLGTKKTSPGYVGAFFSGLIAGVVASPCVGPVLVVILAYVATTGSKLYGFFLLFTYAMGLGLIFLILGAFTNLTRRLPRSGPWLETVKFLLGSSMLGAFYYYLNLLIDDRWFDGALGIGLVVLGSTAGAFQPVKGTHAFARIRKGFTQAILFIGFGYLALAVFDLRPALMQRSETTIAKSSEAGNWGNLSDEALAKATAEKRPVVIDFWAEWCAACHELEQHTFADSRVKALSERFVLLRYDATKDSSKLRELKNKWKIQGLPTVLFINPNGVWLEDLTLTEFEKPERFLLRMEKALN